LDYKLFFDRDMESVVPYQAALFPMLLSLGQPLAVGWLMENKGNSCPKAMPGILYQVGAGFVTFFW
jgi:hypothetical protein